VSYAIVYTADASQDLEEVLAYVAARDGPARADDLFENIVETVAQLTTFPERGNIPRELEALGLSGFRELRYKPYRVIYEIGRTGVIIYGILDGRRDMQSLLQQRLTR